MKRYRLPGYEVQLLGELQKQQNSAQFCDTLLQTEGISVPTHSCVLAALSPYLFRKLSAIPSPPSGQKRRLQLQAVKPQTLLKLVGLLYSGELEVKGSIEQNDVLAAAHQFGMVDLVEGQKDEKTKEVELQERWRSLGRCSKYCIYTEERDKSRKMQDAQVQAMMAGRRDTYSPVEKRSCVSTGTQTVKVGEKAVGTSLALCSQTKARTPEPAPSDVQSSDLSILFKPQNITLQKQFCSTSFPPIPRMPRGAPSDGESTSNQSSDRITNPTPTSQVCSNLIVPVSLNDASNSPTPAEEGAYQQSSQPVDSIQVFAKERAGLEDGQTNKDQMSGKRDDRGLTPGEGKGNSKEKRHVNANIGMKSLAKMKQMMETAQISIKVKLRRRTNGELWEVVSMQGADETLSVLTSLTQKPETPIPQPASSNSLKAPPHHNTSDSVTPNHTGELVPHDPVEESDEQIEKLLEDIMMGLNILPNLERDCKKPHHLSTTLNAAICQVPVTENEANRSQIDAAVAASDRVCYQDCSGHSSTDTGICCFTAQNQPSNTILSLVPSDAALSQQQSSPQHHSSVRSVGQPDEMLLSKSQNSLYPEAATSAVYSRLQEPHYPAFQAASSQEEQNVLEFLRLSNENETLSLHSFSSPCMEDLRLPQCLSPLEPRITAAKQHPDLNISVNHGNNTEQQPSLHQRPWLTEDPGLLQFPLSAIAHRANKCTSLKQDTNRTYGSTHCLEHLEFNPQHGRTCPDSGPENKVGEKRRISASSQNAAELKCDPRRAKKSFECKKSDTKNQKRKNLSETQDAVCPVLAYQNLKVSDVTKGRINLSICSVSLSSNNVLLKEREMATCSSKMPIKCGGKANQQSTMTEKLKEKTRSLQGCTEMVNTDQTRIRTRGFLRKAQEMPSNTSTEKSPVPKSVISSTTIVTKQVSLSRRKRGRPQKIKVEELTPPDSVPPIIEKKGHNEGKDEPKKDLENSGKTKSECKKRKRNLNAEVEVIPPKKTINAESTAAAEGKNNNDVIPAVRKAGKPKHTVALEKLQKLIKQQHLKTRKSKVSQETNETVRNAEDERKAHDNAVSNCEEESTSEAEMDINVTQPEDSVQTEDSHVIFSVTADENHNHIFKKSTAGSHRSRRGDTSSTAGRETRDTHPLSTYDVLEEEVVAKLAAEGEQPVNGQASPHSTGLSDKTQTATNDGGSSHSDWNPQTVETAGPSLSDANRFSWSSGCNQEEEEVDVLLYSPDKEPQSKECEDGLDNTYETPDEEEEEDVNEIDVTGDEAE